MADDYLLTAKRHITGKARMDVGLICLALTGVVDMGESVSV